MKFSKIELLFLCFCGSLFWGNLRGVTVGSNSTPSRQLRTFFPAADTNNLMMGFAVFEKGFVLEDSTTTCSFDAFFPVSDDVVLNGGSLFLLRDLELKSPFTIGPGTVNGRSFTVEFPGNVSSVNIPTENHDKLLSLVDEVDAGAIILSVDWSHDDQYLAVSLVSSGVNELQIYYLNSLVLTLTLSQDFGVSDVRTVKWHPSDYYLALGQYGGTELQVYYLNVASGTLDNKSSDDIGDIQAVAWSPAGDYLAVGRKKSTSFIVYEVNAGVLGSSYSGSLLANSTVENNALDWDSTGSYIALGLQTSTDAEFRVFHFDGASLTESAKIEVGAIVYSVGWIPQSSLLSVGQGASSDRLRLYEHDSGAGTLVEKTTARVGNGQNVYALDWTSSGVFVATGNAATSAAHELNVFSYNSTDYTLSLVAGRELGQNVKIVRWSHDNNYIATGDVSGYLRVFQMNQQQLIFRDAKLFFNSDVVFNGPVVFKGTCVLNGGGNVFTFGASGSLAVASGGSLLIEEAIIRGIKADDIGCAANDAVITLRDVVWNQDSAYTFSTGAMRFQKDIFMTGEAIFAYSSSQTSTLLVKSELELDAGFTFSYDPGSASKTLFEMVDETSKLTLNGATLHVTVTGMQLTKGKLRVLRDSFIFSETQGAVDEGVTFGNDASASDLKCDIFSGVTLWLNQGSLNYRNVNASSWQVANVTSVLRMGVGTTLNLYQSIDLGGGVLTLDNNTIIGRALGKNITGSIRPLGILTYSNI